MVVSYCELFVFRPSSRMAYFTGKCNASDKATVWWILPVLHDLCLHFPSLATHPRDTRRLHSLRTPNLPFHELVSFLFQGLRLKLKRVADDVSCSVFVLANAVTILFYAIEAFVPGGVTSKSLGVPIKWVNMSVHLLNSVVAWTDIIISHPRRFGRRSFAMTVCFSLGYLIWLLIIKSKSGKYPYGFLNVLPEPYGLLFVALADVVVKTLLFLFGRKLSQMTRFVMAPERLEDLDVVKRNKLKENENTLSDAEEVNSMKVD